MEFPIIPLDTYLYLGPINSHKRVFKPFGFHKFLFSNDSTLRDRFQKIALRDRCVFEAYLCL